MRTGWRYDESTSGTGGWPDGHLADQATGRPYPPFEAPAAPVSVPAPRATTAEHADNFPGEHALRDQVRSVQYWAERANAKSCWMCGIRLPADQMVADGGSACLDLRWYCRDTWACTERWTWNSARSAALRQGTAEAPKTPGEQATAADAGRPVPV
jgi:hypothetical protein